MIKKHCLPFVQVVSALVLVCLFSVAAFSQANANKGQIAGTVIDPSQAAVAGAKIAIKNTSTGAVRQLTSGAGGQYQALLLDPGSYSVTVDAPGFAQAVFTGVVVNVGSAVDLTIALQVGATVQSVDVGESLLQLDPNPSSLVNSQAIENLPINGRRFQDFAALTPTVQIDQARGSISFAGQRGINGNVMVDGTDYNNPFFGGTRGGERSGFVFTIPQSSIQEFQAVTTGYAAEYGRSTGGILNAISKSGGNTTHGEAFYQIRHKETGLQTPFLTQNLETLQQFGGGAGGAVKKDKLFWFAAAERQMSRLPRTIQFATLNGFATTPQTQEAYNFYRGLEQGFKSTNDGLATTGRLDYQFANGNRLTARLNFSDANADNAITTGAALPTIDTRALSGTGAEKDRTFTGVAQYTSILTPSVVNDLRFSGTHENRPRTSNSSAPNVTDTIGNFGARNFLPTVQDDTRYQINDGLSMTRGSHTFKVGGDYNYLTTYQSFGFNQFGTFSFSNSTNIPLVLQNMSTTTGQNRFDNTNVRYAFQIGNLQADYHMHQIAFYAQDTWKITNRFQIHYGVRWEGQINPQAVTSNTAVVSTIQAATLPLTGKAFDPSVLNNNLNQWMPRFGFTYSPLKSNKMVLRGHTGLFYAASPMLIYGGSTNNFRLPPGDVSFTYIPTATSPTVYQLFKQAGVDLNTAKLDSLPILTATQVTNSLAALTGVAPNPFLGAAYTGTANDYKNPRAFQAGLGVENEIAKNWVASAQFNYINTVHLERNRDFNLPAPAVRAADGRFVFVRGNRPLPQYSTITLRDSSARSLYRGATFSTRYTASKRIQFGLQYTLAQSYSDDDNERSAGGFTYDNPFNMKLEYGYSNLDIRHNFSTYAVGNLPWGMELSGIFRVNSGQPIDPAAGSDVNGDGSSSDRAYQAVGVPFARNSFRNNGFKTMDIRFLKSVKFGEQRRLQFSTEIFNLFNFDNIVIAGNNLNYGMGISATGATVAPNATFLLLRNADGTYNRTNNQLGTPLQAQFGLRFIF